MSDNTSDPRDPKKLPDPVSGVETNEQITNSEDQQMVDDLVGETSDSTLKSDEEPTLSEKDKRDITDIN